MKYRRPESSKKALLKMIRRLFKENLELKRQLHVWREFKEELVKDLKP